MTRPAYFRPPLERDIVPALLNVARAMGHFAEVNGVHRRGETRRSGLGPGSPDIVVLLYPLWVCLFVEVKRDGKQKLRPSQVKWHAMAKRLGLHVVTVSTVDEMVDAIIATARKTIQLRRDLVPRENGIRSEASQATSLRSGKD